MTFFLSTIILAVALSSCAPTIKTSSTPTPTGSQFSESCKSCGTPHNYSYSWSDEDYAFLQAAYSGKAFRSKSPHGPTPACDSTYVNDTSFEGLKIDIPNLKKSTYISFLTSNKLIAVHNVESAPIRINNKEGMSLSRPGFNSNKTQALVCSGQFFTLYVYNKGKWEYAGGSILWIS